MRYIRLEMPIRCPSRPIKEELGYVNIEFKEGFQAGDTYLRVIRTEMVFKATRLDEITMDISLNREETQGLSLEHSNI